MLDFTLEAVNLIQELEVARWRKPLTHKLVGTSHDISENLQDLDTSAYGAMR